MVGYGRRRIPSRCALKVDIQKAFDSISWLFVIDALHAYKFSQVFVEWISACITSPKFSVNGNGGFKGFFPGTRMVR